MSAPKKSTRPTRGTQPSEPALEPVEHSDGTRIDRLRELVSILERSSLSELAYEDQDIAVTLRRQTATSPAPIATVAPPVVVATPTAHHAPAHRSETGLSTRSAAAAREEPDVFVVRSPFVGTFYRAAAPTSPPFSEINQAVRRGQTICIIEAMKLMNEIESEVDGKVIEILVENAQSVQYGEPLFRIRIKP